MNKYYNDLYSYYTSGGKVLPNTSSVVTGKPFSNYDNWMTNNYSYMREQTFFEKYGLIIGLGVVVLLILK